MTITNKLYTVPLGETMRNEFIKEGEKYAYGDALFVVPGKIIMDEVKKSGKVRTVNMDFLPNEILRHNYADEQFVRITRSAQEMLISDLLERLVEEGKITYFAPLVGKEGFLKNLVSFIGELARQRVKENELKDSFDNWDRQGDAGKKDQEISLIYTEYKTILEDKKLYDVDRLYSLAIAELEKDDASVPWQQLYFSEFYKFDQLQTDFIIALSKHCNISIGLFYDGQRPDLSLISTRTYENLIGEKFSLEGCNIETKRTQTLKHFCQKWQSANSKKIDANGITLYEAYGPEREMRLVLGDIKKKLLDKTYTCEEMICLVRSMEDYNGFSNLFKEYGIPCALPEVTSFASHPVNKLVESLLLVLANPMDIENLKGLLANELIGVIYNFDNKKLEEEYNDYYFSTTKELKEHIKEQGDINDLFSTLEELGKKKKVEAFFTAFSNYVATWHLEKKYGALYQEDKVGLVEMKATLSAVEEIEAIVTDINIAFEQSDRTKENIDLYEIYTLWQEKASEKHLTLRLGNPIGIKVVEVSSIQSVPFKCVYVLGLREGSFPRIRHENWIYNDKDRMTLSNDFAIYLGTTLENIGEDNYFFASAIAMATEEVVLSYYSDDAKGASSYIAELNECFNNLTVIKGRADIDECYSQNVLGKLLATKEKLDAEGTAFITSLAGKDYFSRSAIDKTRFDGESNYNGYLTEEVDAKKFSATALKTYVTCPFSYLGQRVWNLNAWAPLDGEVEANVAGTLYHRVLATFLSRYTGKNIANEKEAKLLGELLEDLQTEYKKMLANGEINENEFSSYDYANYKFTLTKWLNSEQDYQRNLTIPFKPTEFELSFGYKNGKNPAISLDIAGDKVQFIGQIDRIDTDGTNYMLTDYKSGSYPSAGDIFNFYDMQLPLYALALSTIKNVPLENIYGAGYYSLSQSARKGGMWNKDAKGNVPWIKRKGFLEIDTIMDRLTYGLEKIVTSIKEGKFPTNPANGCPSYCEYKDICRYKLISELLQEGEENNG